MWGRGRRKDAFAPSSGAVARPLNWRRVNPQHAIQEVPVPKKRPNPEIEIVASPRPDAEEHFQKLLEVVARGLAEQRDCPGERAALRKR